MATDTRGDPETVSARRRETTRPPAAPPAERSRARSAVTLTGRGGTAVVLACTLLGAVIGGMFGLRSAQGLFFVVGCLLAVLATRRTDLLTLVVSPPLLFFLVTLVSALIGSVGEKSFLLSTVVAVAAKLTSSVPWLFVGAVLVVLIAVPRGLPANLRDLSARVAADNPFRGRTSLRGRKKDEDDDPVRWDESPGRLPAAKAPPAEESAGE
ncbi:DUF6542 domain-containing protein [Actinoallomurus sp. NPDC050550]|uniref:DUF6542 domain-containing protein n=1 Tax=Actinoallomurus sp. NPDC050550 TaxID=3154937 RepID=UPI0033F07DE0